jgi:GT2 family glycosyltransferase
MSGVEVQLTISIVIIGDQPLVLPCLESIEAQTRVEHEIYLVENLASQVFIEKITKQFPKVKFIHNSQRLSFAANHNQVLQRCQGEFILLLNDDTVIMGQALDRMVEFLAAYSAEVGIVGCTNLDQDGNFTLSCYPFPSAKTIFWQHAGLRRWFPGRAYEQYLTLAKQNEPFSTGWIKGSCMLIRREVIKRIGYLDEEFFLFSEEVDYCYRAQKAGFSIYQVPQARILHYESTTTNRFVGTKLRGHYLSKLYFLAKHGFNRDLYLVRAWFILELLGKSLIRGLGTLFGRPPDAQERLQAYWSLLRICLTYQGQPASSLIQRE